MPPQPGPSRSPKRRASSSPAAACSSWICASTIRSGSPNALGDRWQGFSDAALAKLLKAGRALTT